MEVKKSVNRRKHERVKVEAGAYVAFRKPRFFNLLKPDLIKLGPIVDISRGGLAVQYIESKERSYKFEEISILTAADEVVFDKVPFTNVHEEIIGELPNSTPIKKLCLQFGNLSGYQIFRLEQFIQNLNLKILPFEAILDKKKPKASPVPKKRPASRKDEHSQPAEAVEKPKQVTTISKEEKDEKNKFEMQTDILNKFRAIKAKDGYVLTPDWLQKTYIPSLSENEKKSFKGAVSELVIQGIIEIIKEPKQNFMLTQKGEKLIYKSKKPINYV